MTDDQMVISVHVGRGSERVSASIKLKLSEAAVLVSGKTVKPSSFEYT